VQQLHALLPHSAQPDWLHYGTPAATPRVWTAAPLVPVRVRVVGEQLKKKKKKGGGPFRCGTPAAPPRVLTAAPPAPVSRVCGQR